MREENSGKTQGLERKKSVQEPRLRGSDYKRRTGQSTARREPTTQAGNSARIETERKKKQEKKGENTEEKELTTQARKDARIAAKRKRDQQNSGKKHSEEWADDPRQGGREESRETAEKTQR